MSVSKQVNIRLPERTKQQIQELVKAGGYRSQAELIMILVDREHQKEKTRKSKPSQNEA
jgi:Arc/MetJ-type ribon-helix-helix transcriptional regulator